MGKCVHQFFVPSSLPRHTFGRVFARTRAWSSDKTSLPKRLYVSHIWKFCWVAEWFFSFERKPPSYILGETFRPRAERHNVAIHPYFHVLCVISLSVSYGSALFSGTESASLIVPPSNSQCPWFQCDSQLVKKAKVFQFSEEIWANRCWRSINFSYLLQIFITIVYLWKNVSVHALLFFR